MENPFSDIVAHPASFLFEAAVAVPAFLTLLFAIFTLVHAAVRHGRLRCRVGDAVIWLEIASNLSSIKLAIHSLTSPNSSSSSRSLGRGQPSEHSLALQ